MRIPVTWMVENISTRPRSSRSGMRAVLVSRNNCVSRANTSGAIGLPALRTRSYWPRPRMTGSGVSGAPLLNKQDADRQRRFQIVIAQHLPKRVAELFEAHQGLAAVFLTGAAEYLEGPGIEAGPVVVTGGRQWQQAPQHAAQQEQPPHSLMVAPP
jgi:hypothetical protein